MTISTATNAPMPLWLAYVIVGTIDDHWWMGSQLDEEGRSSFDPDACGPCMALQMAPRADLEEAVRVYNAHCGDDGLASYWDSGTNSFRNGVDFSRPGDIDALVASESHRSEYPRESPAQSS